jgi:hypothetical protein
MCESLADFFRTDRVPFSAMSLNSGTTRSFDSFSEAIEEVVDARVWSGIHFRNAGEDGARGSASRSPAGATGTTSRSRTTERSIGHWERRVRGGD